MYKSRLSIVLIALMISAMVLATTDTVSSVNAVAERAISGVIVLSYSSYVAPSTTVLASEPGDLIIVGEVENVGSNIIGNVTVEGSAFSSTGTELATTTSQAFVYDMLPEQKAPFYIDLNAQSSISKDLSWVSSVSTVAVTVTSVTETTATQYSGLTIPAGSSASYLPGNGSYYVIGTVVNNGNQVAQDPWVVTTFYNVGGAVVGLNFTNYLTSSLPIDSPIKFYASPTDETSQLTNEITSYLSVVDSLTLSNSASSQPTSPSSSPTSPPTLSSTATPSSSLTAVEIVKSVPFNGEPIMVYDSYKSAVWVNPDYLSGYGAMGMPIYLPSNTVLAISDSDNTVLANVTVGQNPTSLAYDSALHEVYVTTNGNGVVVISDMSNSVVATIDSNTNLSSAGNIVYDSGKGEMFVSSGVFGGVLVISDITNQVVASIPLGGNPPLGALTYDSAKGEIYVSCSGFLGQYSENYISVISDSTNSVIATIPLDKSITLLGSGAYDSATGEIYLPTFNSSVLVVSDKTHTVIDSIPLESFPPQFSPINVAYDPVKSVLFAGAVYDTYIISDRTRSVIETVPIDSDSMVYDSGKNVMLDMGNGTIQFVSDASLPSVSPAPTVPEFPSWIILPLFAVIILLLTVFARKRNSVNRNV